MHKSKKEIRERLQLLRMEVEGMKRIEEKTKTEIYQTTEKMILKIQSSLREIDDAKKYLQEMCEKEKLDTYYTWTIDERLNEAEVRLNMSLIRIQEFRMEADNLKLSTSGFY